jgi:hypothetical protein
MIGGDWAEDRFVDWALSQRDPDVVNAYRNPNPYHLTDDVILEFACGHRQAFQIKGKTAPTLRKFGARLPDMSWTKPGRREHGFESWCFTNYVKAGSIIVIVELNGPILRLPEDLKFDDDKIAERLKPAGFRWGCHTDCPRFRQHKEWLCDGAGEHGDETPYFVYFDRDLLIPLDE